MSKIFSTNVNMNNNDITGVDSITMNTSTSQATGTGTILWDTSFDTIIVGLNSSVNLQVGQEHLIRVKNASATTAIPNMAVVMFAGSTGDTITVSPSVADGTYSSDYLVGIATQTIAADGFGFVTQFGFVNGLDTSAWAVGTLLYASSSTAGALTSTQPTGKAWKVPIAAVTRQHATTGRILVRALPSTTLSENDDVVLSSLANNDILAYDSATTSWKNKTSSTLGLIDTSSTTQTKTGNFYSSGNIAGNMLISNASAAHEGGQIELAIPSSGSTLSGPVTIDVYDNKLRFFEGGGTNRGAYIDLTSAASSASTNLLGGTTGAMNWDQQASGKVSGVSASGTTIVSRSFTTNGYPVQVMVTGDAENSTAGGWVVVQLYRDSTAIGKKVHIESSAASENIPYALTFIDQPTAGTYTYALKTTTAVSTGTMNFGETDGPVLTMIELSGPKGDTGAGGATNTFATISTPSGTSPVADSSTDTLTLLAGSNITITGDSTADSVTIATTANDVAYQTSAPSSPVVGDIWIDSDSTSDLLEIPMTIAISDESTAITTGTAKITFRAPFAMNLTRIPRASVATASTSGLVTVDINEEGTSVLGANKLSIDANEKTSVTAATATTLADTAIADDAEITIDIDAAGTGAKGLKVTLYYNRA